MAEEDSIIGPYHEGEHAPLVGGGPSFL